MNLEQLRAFVTAAEEKNYTRAGERLYLSHSTVSRAVSSLEREFGVSLIRRGNQVIGMTPEGEKLYALAKRLLSLADEIDREMKN